MGIGSEIGKEGGVVAQGLFQSLIAWLYNKIFATQIAAQEEKNKAILTELEQLRAEKTAQIATDQKGIDQAEGQKAPIVQQIKGEEEIQQKDEATIKQVQDDLTKKLDSDRSESAHDLVRDQF